MKIEEGRREEKQSDVSPGSYFFKSLHYGGRRKGDRRPFRDPALILRISPAVAKEEGKGKKGQILPFMKRLLLLW